MNMFQKKVASNIEHRQTRVQEIAAEMAEAAKAMDMNTLASRTATYYERCGELSIDKLCEEVCNNVETEAEAIRESMRLATDILIRGADDGWSGRSNDLQRAFFDGQRREIQTLKYLVENAI